VGWVKRPGAPLDAEGSVEDRAVQSELPQDRHAGILVVSEQAGGPVVGSRDRDLVCRDVGGGIERQYPR